jgi:hypothetical protein
MFAKYPHFYFHVPTYTKVLDRELHDLLTKVYSGEVGYLPRNEAVPFRMFRIGRIGYYYSHWDVCFYSQTLDF